MVEVARQGRIDPRKPVRVFATSEEEAQPPTRLVEDAGRRELRAENQLPAHKFRTVDAHVVLAVRRALKIGKQAVPRP
jgi:hypothetical protein